MVQVDLITGFLGAGKTTFLRRYAAYLAGQGERVCILENDFGAVNVDAMLVQDLLELGSEARMNTPSTTGGNWRWRLTPGALGPELAESLCQKTAAYGRLPTGR